MLAKYWIEDMVGMQVNVEIASEFRYRHPFMSRDSLFVFISQSGETIDTLCAMRNILAERLSAISIVNVPGSSIAREATYTIYTHAGVEIGVASTKAFISQALTLLLLAVPKGNICSDKIAKAMFSIIQRQSEFEEVAKSIVNSRAIMCIGRGTSYPIALECALKMKEITYICSEGHPAGEIKHGPMALIDKNVCTIVLTPQDRYREKTLSNAQEIMARNGQILTIGSNKIDVCPAIVIENISEIGNPFVCATAIHLLAYHTAKAKGVDVDKPRNLAKSVTVE
jgi:glucosamine--fructose-6-phosphate aminotransferase (isomerizing)